MKLRQGKMTGHEIAKWLGISYKTYSNAPKKHLEKLKGYCEYDYIRGGAIIHTIYTDIFYGDLQKDAVKDYIKEIKEKKNKISSVAGMARKLQRQTKYQDLKFDTLKYQLTQAALVAFGPTNGQYTVGRGAYGSRYLVWAIKLDDYNNYRYFTVKEKLLFESLITEFYSGVGPEKFAELALLDSELADGNITVEEYMEQRDNAGLNFFDQCISRFRDKTGLIVAKAQQHEVKEFDNLEWGAAKPYGSPFANEFMEDDPKPEEVAVYEPSIKEIVPKD